MGELLYYNITGVHVWGRVGYVVSPRMVRSDTNPDAEMMGLLRSPQ